MVDILLELWLLGSEIKLEGAKILLRIVFLPGEVESGVLEIGGRRKLRKFDIACEYLVTGVCHPFPLPESNEAVMDNGWRRR